MDESGVVMKSHDGALRLTEKRVLFREVSIAGNGAYMSIPLDKVAHCALIESAFPWLLFLAFMFALVGIGLLATKHQEGGYAMGAGLLVFVAWGITKKKTMVIASSSGGEIRLPVTAGADETIAFLEAVEDQRIKFRETP